MDTFAFTVFAGTDTLTVVPVMRLTEAFWVPNKTEDVLDKLIPVMVTDVFLVPDKVNWVALAF